MGLVIRMQAKVLALLQYDQLLSQVDLGVFAASLDLNFSLSLQHCSLVPLADWEVFLVRTVVVLFALPQGCPFLLAD